MKKTNEGKKRAIFKIINADGSTQLVKLATTATIIGRAKGDIIIDDNEISSTHCQIQKINNEYHIFDMNSTNGTFLNNEKIIKSKIIENDVIKVGQTMIIFKIVDESHLNTVSTIFEASNKNINRTERMSVVDTLIESVVYQQKLPEIKLEVTYGNGTKDKLLFNQEVIYIGRASSFGSFDSDSEISRKHLKIKLNNLKELFIEDQDSTNGVYLNGTKIRGIHKVSDADIISIGSCKITITLI